jgi:hypothetical protein
VTNLLPSFLPVFSNEQAGPYLYTDRVELCTLFLHLKQLTLILVFLILDHEAPFEKAELLIARQHCALVPVKGIRCWPPSLEASLERQFLSYQSPMQGRLRSGLSVRTTTLAMHHREGPVSPCCCPLGL